jgi:acetyltransferase-like isoleucine patch superfamily enzyme
MKNILEKIIRFRNPTFTIDKDIDSIALFQFFLKQGFALLRGLRILFYFKNPKGLMLGSHVKLFNQNRLLLGKWVKLDDFVQVSALGREGISIGNQVSIGAFSRIIVATSLNNIGNFIRIGNNVGIGEFAYLGGAGGLEIGSDTIVGQYFSCHPENHNYNEFYELIRHQGVSRKGIKIGKNCWIGSKVTMLDGVSVGDGCVIAAGSVVTKSFPSNSVIGGVPAKLLKSRVPQSSLLEYVA